MESIVGYNDIEKIEFIKPLEALKLDKTALWFESFLRTMKSSIFQLTQVYINRLVKNNGMLLDGHILLLYLLHISVDVNR